MAIRDILQQVALGNLSPAEAEARLGDLHTAQLGFAALDLHREARRGRAEAVFCEGKTADQVLAIAAKFRAAGQNAIFTRLSPDQSAALRSEIPAGELHEVPAARWMQLRLQPVAPRAGMAAVLAAGTGDLPIAEEAAATAEAFGTRIYRAYDVGVAGLHRLFPHAEALRTARAIVVVAGMDGALPSVVSGLTRVPVIAVPTSIGYGAHFGGLAPLLAMLNSCSPGVCTVNIDNGYGAGYLADMMCEGAG